MTKLGKAYLSLFTCILSFILIGVIVSILPNTERNEPPILKEDEYLSQNCSHNYGEWETTLEPTCTTTGTEKQICTICDFENVRTVSTVAHTYEIFREEKPTCFVRGTAIYKCVNCESSYVEDLPPQHTSTIDKAVLPTCTTTGLTEGEHCTACGEIIIAQNVIEALGHKETTDQAISPTCTTTGLTQGSHCSVCNAIFVNQTVIPATGHTNGKWITDANPTCTEDGSKHQVCSVCTDTINTEIIPATGHTEEIIPAKSATCTTTGLTEGKKCSVCEATLVKQYQTSSTGHSMYLASSTPANCLGGGIDHMKCKNCSHTVDVPNEDVAEHTFGDWIRQSDGTYKRLCTVCVKTETKPYMTFNLNIYFDQVTYEDRDGQHTIYVGYATGTVPQTVNTNEPYTITLARNATDSGYLTLDIYGVANCYAYLTQTVNTYTLRIEDITGDVVIRIKTTSRL